MTLVNSRYLQKASEQRTTIWHVHIPNKNSAGFLNFGYNCKKVHFLSRGTFPSPTNNGGCFLTTLWWTATSLCSPHHTTSSAEQQNTPQHFHTQDPHPSGSTRQPLQRCPMPGKALLLTKHSGKEAHACLWVEMWYTYHSQQSLALT